MTRRVPGEITAMRHRKKKLRQKLKIIKAELKGLTAQLKAWC
jgi:hypothetical protein